MAIPSISNFTFLDSYFLDFQWDIYLSYNNDPLAADDDGELYRGSNITLSSPKGGGKGATKTISFSQYIDPFRFAGAPLSSGLRDVQGFNNNEQSPYNGATLTLFERLFPANYSNISGGFNLTPSGASGMYGPIYASTYDPTLKIDYKTRGTIVIDAQPRIISNLVANTKLVPAGANLLDDPRAREWTPFGTQLGLRQSPLTGGVNPLPASSWMTGFGQFFDHGLSLIGKGKDGRVFMPLLPGDPLYDPTKGSAVLSQGRNNTIRVEIGEGSSNSLLLDLGLTEFVDPGVASLSSTTLQNDAIKASYLSLLSSSKTGITANSVATATGGSFVLNGLALVIPANATWAQVETLINGAKSSTGVTAKFNQSSSNTGQLVLSPASGESVNRISAFVDLGQAYGSVQSLKVLLKEYDATGMATGRLLTKNDGKQSTLSDWAAIKANALKLGLILHDYNIKEVPLIEKDSLGSFRFVALNASSGSKVLITDTADARLNLAADNPDRLVLLGAGVAFLDDIAPGTNGSLLLALKSLNSAIKPDLSGADKTLLDSHYVPGDGRANENVGLTAMHQIFHTIHNQIAVKIVADWNALSSAEKTLLAGSSNAPAPSGDELFEKAKLVTEMIYQHRVFDEFARKVSPNIGAFKAYSPLIQSGISLEFSQGIFRFGHSQVNETVDLQPFNTNTGLAEGSPNSFPLLQMFLNPSAFKGEVTAGEVSLGMGNQVQNQIDQFVTETLRSNLLGAGLDLASFNLSRGRDTGLPSLNAMRAEIYKSLQLNVVPGLTASAASPTAAALLDTVNDLRPYVSWRDFADHLLIPGSEKQFIMAYARDTILSKYASLPISKAKGKPALLYPDWNAYQIADPTNYLIALDGAAAQAMADSAFMGMSWSSSKTPSGNQDFNAIDAWIGGLAEAKTPGGMLGPLFDFIFALQMAKLQDGDNFYYLNRIAGTDFFTEEIDSRTFSDLVMEATGTRHLYHDILSVNDSDVEIASMLAPSLASPSSLSGLGNQAGWVRTMNGTASIDTFYGNPGDYASANGILNANGRGNSSEMIGGTNAAERINALGGNDCVYGDGGNDSIDGGLGNDFLDGGDGDDTISDAGGDDFIRGGNGNDGLHGGIGDDALFGQAGGDTIHGGDGADAIEGGDGDDLLYGGNNLISNGLLDGSDLANAIGGGRGNDSLYGGGAVDDLHGGVGADLLVGGGAADNIACGLDNDADIVWFNEPLVNGVFDSISEFTVAGSASGYTANDLLRFSRLSLPQTNLAPVLGTLASGQFQTTTSLAPQGSTSTVRFLYNAVNGQLWYDPDGNGALAALHVATLEPYNPLNANDPLALPPVIAPTNIQIV